MIASPLLAVGSARAASSAIRPQRASRGAAGARCCGRRRRAIAFVLSRPVPPRREVLGAEDRAYLRGVALKTWRYFDTFIGPDDHALPPDNVQIAPDVRVAHRTSPTNIAHGTAGDGRRRTTWASSIIDGLVTRLDATLTTVEGLEQFEGHLLNWYDTETLAPLQPAYVSTVDSGNLAGALVTLAAALPRLPRRCR